MKTKFLSILSVILFSLSLTAGELTDSANVFGPENEKINQELKSIPVWIETFVEIPHEGLKNYADDKVKILTSKGFLLVITTQPRQWRISMNPIGIASSESIRMAGDNMVKYFKKGQFSDGVIQLSKKLVQLIQTKTVPVKIIQSKDNNTDSSFILSFKFTLFIFLITILIIFIIFLVKNSKPKISNQAKKDSNSIKKENKEDFSNTEFIKERQKKLVFLMLVNDHPTQTIVNNESYSHSKPSSNDSYNSDSSSDYSSSFDSSSSFDADSSSFSDSSGGGGSW